MICRKFIFCCFIACLPIITWASEVPDLTITENTNPKIVELYQQLQDAKTKIDKIQSEHLDKLNENYQAMKEKEQSKENRTLTAATTAATGIGGMELAQGLAEQRADKTAEQDMAAYLATMRCEYGNGKQVKAGPDEIELPGGNNAEMMKLRAEYFALAADLKERKAALGMKPGIESEEILDKSQLDLYNDESIGITDGAYASIYRAQMLGSAADQEQIDADKNTSKNRVIGGGVAAAAGVVGGIVGDMKINKDAPKENSDKINREYDKQVAEAKAEQDNISQQLNQAIAENAAAVQEYNKQVQQHKDQVALIKKSPNTCRDLFTEYISKVDEIQPIANETDNVPQNTNFPDINEQQELLDKCQTCDTKGGVFDSVNHTCPCPPSKPIEKNGKCVAQPKNIEEKPTTTPVTTPQITTTEDEDVKDLSVTKPIDENEKTDEENNLNIDFDTDNLMSPEEVEAEDVPIEVLQYDCENKHGGQWKDGKCVDKNGNEIKDDKAEYCPATGNGLKSITDKTKVGDECSSTNIAQGEVVWRKDKKSCTCLAYVCNDGFRSKGGQCLKNEEKLPLCPRQKWNNVENIKTGNDALKFCERKAAEVCTESYHGKSKIAETGFKENCKKQYPKGCIMTRAIMYKNNGKKNVLCNGTQDEQSEAKQKIATQKQEAMYKAVCGDDKNKTGKKEYCVTDFFNWTQTTLPYAINFAQDYARLKHGNTIQCSDEEPRKAGNDDYIKCATKDGSILYEFKFDDVKEGVDVDRRLTERSALCRLIGGDVRGVDNNRICHKINSDACTKKLNPLAQKYGHTVKWEKDRCNFYSGTVKKDPKNSIYKEVCGADKGKTGKKEYCVSDFFNWTQTQMLQAIGFAQDYARLKHGNTIQCSDEEPRKAGNDDYIKCATKDGSILYEFKFDDVKEGVDVDRRLTERSALCRLIGGDVRGVDNNRICHKINSDACTKKLNPLAQKYGHTVKWEKDRCNFTVDGDRNNMDTQEFENSLAKIDGLDNYYLFTEIQIRGSKNLIRQLESYVKSQNIKYSSFRCNDGYETVKKVDNSDLKTKVVSVVAGNHDDILRCYVDKKPIDFVFDDLSETWKTTRESGESAIECKISGGVYANKNCHGLNFQECTEMGNKLKEQNPQSSGTDYIDGDCILLDVQEQNRLDKGIQIATGVVALADCALGTHFGCKLAIVEGVSLFMEMASGAEMQKRADEFLKVAAACKNRSCAKNTLKTLGGRAYTVADQLSSLSTAKSIDEKLAELIGYLEPEDLQGEISDDDFAEIIRQLGGDPDDLAGRALKTANKIGFIGQFASVGASTLRLTGKAVAKLGAKAGSKTAVRVGSNMADALDTTKKTADASKGAGKTADAAGDASKGGKATPKPDETKPKEPETGTPKPKDSAPKGKSIEEIEDILGDRYKNVKPEVKRNPDRTMVFGKDYLTDEEWKALNESLAKENLEVVPSGEVMFIRQKRVFPDRISDIRNRAYSEFNSEVNKIKQGISNELHVPKAHLSDEEWKLLEADLNKEGLEITEANSHYYTVRKSAKSPAPKATPKVTANTASKTAGKANDVADMSQMGKLSNFKKAGKWADATVLDPTFDIKVTPLELGGKKYYLKAGDTETLIQNEISRTKQAHELLKHNKIVTSVGVVEDDQTVLKAFMDAHPDITLPRTPDTQYFIMEATHANTVEGLSDAKILGYLRNKPITIEEQNTILSEIQNMNNNGLIHNDIWHNFAIYRDSGGKLHMELMDFGDFTVEDKLLRSNDDVLEIKKLFSKWSDRGLVEKGVAKKADNISVATSSVSTPKGAASTASKSAGKANDVAKVSASEAKAANVATLRQSASKSFDKYLAEVKTSPTGKGAKLPKSRLNDAGWNTVNESLAHDNVQLIDTGDGYMQFVRADHIEEAEIIGVEVVDAGKAVKVSASEAKMANITTLRQSASKSFDKYLAEVKTNSTGKGAKLPKSRLNDAGWNEVNKSLASENVQLVDTGDGYMQFVRADHVDDGAKIIAEVVPDVFDARKMRVSDGSGKLYVRNSASEMLGYPVNGDDAVNEVNQLYGTIRRGIEYPVNDTKVSRAINAMEKPSNNAILYRAPTNNYNWHVHSYNGPRGSSAEVQYHVSLNVEVDDALIKKLDDIMAKDQGRHIVDFKIPPVGSRWKTMADPISIYMRGTNPEIERAIAAAAKPYVRTSSEIGLLGRKIDDGVAIAYETSAARMDIVEDIINQVARKDAGVAAKLRAKGRYSVGNTEALRLWASDFLGYTIAPVIP